MAKWSRSPLAPLWGRAIAIVIASGIDTGPAAGQREFLTTHWSVVLAAGGSDSPQSAAALESLCRAYWSPLYFYVRRHGHDRDDAKDLTQEFFLRLLDKNHFAMADPNRGRFRSFLLTSLKHFLVNEWEKSRTNKRGGGQPSFSMDAGDAEAGYLIEPSHYMTPDRVFEKRWAISLVENVLEQLRLEYVAVGKLDFFNELKSHVWGDGGAPYAEVAVRLKTTEGALRIGAHRMREQFRRLLRAEVANTVATPSEIDAELRHLISVLQS
jgi:RNA polymerase sigma factor (sigma-70 family)